MGNFSCFFVWEQRKLSDETNRIRSYSISHGFEVAEDTGTKYIHYGDIHTGKVKNINNINVLPNIEDNNYKPLKYGDVIVADASEDYKGIADACIVNTISNSYKIVAGLHTIAFRPKSKLCSKFLYFYLSTDIFKHFGYKTGTGLKVFGISYKELAKFKLKEPSATEQKKIVKLLFLIEKAIHLQQRKLKQLQLLQKALIQGLLPYSNKFKPTIKIIKNSSHWYIIPVSNLYKRSNEKNDLSFSIKDIISVAKMHWGQNPKKSDDEYMKTYKVFRKGDIAFEGNRSKKFKYGRFVENNLGNGIVSHVFEVYRPTQTINLSFWKFYIHSEQVMHDILRKSTIKATMMTNLVNNDFLKQSTLVPDQKTQQKLGSLFNLVQSELNKQRKKVDELKFIKKFLLQNIFI